MSGRLPPEFVHVWPLSGPLGDLRAAMRPDLYLRRFYAALLFSCLLHAAIVFLPYLGATSAVSGFPVRAGLKPAPSRILTVRLVTEIPAAGSAVEPPPAAVKNEEPRPEEPRPAPDRSAGIGLLPIPAPAFYTTDQLTKRPQPLSIPSFSVPDTGSDPGTGKVVVNLWISELGSVVSVDVEKDGVQEAIAASAAEAFGKMRYVPGEINGRPVGVVMKIEVTFDSSSPPPSPLPRRPISRSNRLGLNPNP